MGCRRKISDGTKSDMVGVDKHVNHLENLLYNDRTVIRMALFDTVFIELIPPTNSIPTCGCGEL